MHGEIYRSVCDADEATAFQKEISATGEAFDQPEGPGAQTRSQVKRPIDGFICRGDSTMLLYLILDDYRDRPASDTGAALSD